MPLAGGVATDAVDIYPTPAIEREVTLHLAEFRR
jgi:hypothetical protein